MNTFANSLPKVSVIINNYNYGDFLKDAIDSALQQSHPNTEVIVVDDGSTDHSRQIIAAYGDRVTAVIKENGGQGSAFNAGFSRCRGEVVIFLDADDLLLPHIAGRAAAAFQAEASAAKVHYRLEIIDAAGRRSGLTRPPRNQPLPDGDLRRQVLAFPDDLPWQTTSGNAFAANVLRQIFPVPEDAYRLCADYYLSNLPALFGKVIALDEVGGFYRVHAANHHYSATFDLDQTRQIIRRTSHTHRYIKKYADVLDLAGFPADSTAVRSVTFLAHRLISLKLDPRRHPIPEDSLFKLLANGVRAASGRFDLPWPARVLYSLWFAAVLLAPQPGVGWLAEKFFYPERRGRLNNLTTLFRRGVVDGIGGGE